MPSSISFTKPAIDWGVTTPEPSQGTGYMQLQTEVAVRLSECGGISSLS
jgi:hypothetical protein